jgi:mycothiol synthase
MTAPERLTMDIPADRSWELTRLFLRRGLADLPEPPPLPDGFALRRLLPIEAGALAALLSRAFEFEWDEARARKDLVEAPDVEATYVIAHGEQLVATASARLMPDTYPGAGYVHWVGADRDYQGRGLGTAISLRVLEHFRDAGLRAAVLETHNFRLPAIRSYLKMGFVPEPRDPGELDRWSRVLPRLVR